MLAYPYIESLFKAILKHSKVMRGRFHICPQFGYELNTGNLEQVLKYTFTEESKKEYPLAIMLPPPSSGEYTEDGFKDYYEVTMYFLTTTYYTGKNQVKSLNPNTGNSQHSIVEDWHDMKRCAVKFIGALRRVATSHNFFIKEKESPGIAPISTIGNDRVSGVSLSFCLGLHEGCTEEDYPDNIESIINLPAAIDTHPEHLH